MKNNRGQVGIGTLIVFIALVLVAAIAAGVIINTAGFLQTQAEETGEDSTSQVADNINVIGEFGDVMAVSDNHDNPLADEEFINHVQEVRLTVQPSPGSGSTDLTELTIQWVGDNGYAQLVHTSKIEDPPDLDIDTDEDQAEIVQFITNENTDDMVAYDSEDDRAKPVYLVDVITAESGNDAVLTDDGDRYEIVIPIAVAFFDDPDGLESELALIGDFTNTAESPIDRELTSPTLDDVGNRYQTLDVEAEQKHIDNLDLDLLESGQSANLEITTSNGATRSVAISVPDTLIDEEDSTVTL